MARTYRKRKESFTKYYKHLLIEDGWFSTFMYNKYGNKWRDRLRARYYGKTIKGYDMNLPKWFRKDVNRQRRRKDNQRLHLLLTEDSDQILFDPWNCKTSNSWGYW